jgi:zinc and cadmium transporter
MNISQNTYQSFISFFSSDTAIGFIAVVLVSLVSFLGALIFLLSKDRLKKFLPYLVSVSVGALMGDAFLHLLPEAFSEGVHSSMVGGWVLIGFFLFLILEHGLHWHHSHGDEEGDHDHGKHIGGLVTVADSIHNLLDGVIIALGFMLGVEIGVATTIAIVLHEIPQEIGDMGLLLYIGWSKKKALIFNFISALFACVGYVLVLLLGQYTDLLEANLPYFLAAAAGGFLYIAGADLIPELRKNHRTDFVKHIIVILLGVVAMAGLLLLE